MKCKFCSGKGKIKMIYRQPGKHLLKDFIKPNSLNSSDYILCFNCQGIGEQKDKRDTNE